MSRINVIEFEKMLAELESSIAKTREAAAREQRDVVAEVSELENERDTLIREFFEGLTAWDEVLLARHPNRPYTLDYVPLLTEDFLELHGDRLFGEDGAMVSGFARIGGIPALLVGQQKG